MTPLPQECRSGFVKEVGMSTRYLILVIIWVTLCCCLSACDSKGPLTLVSRSKTAGVGYAICVLEHHAYITNNDGVVVFDIQKPERPRKVGELPTGVTFGICAEGDKAYISSEQGLVIADVSNPADAKKIGEYRIGEETHRIHVEDPYVYVASDGGLEIIDVGDPGNISAAAHFGDSRAWGVDVSEGIAYLATSAKGVEVIDVADPGSPQKVRTLDGTKGAQDVHIHDDRLYVGRHGAGIAIFDISDRRSPAPLGSFRDDDDGEALGVWGDDEYLYVADNFGIEALDVSDPASPYEIGEYGRVRGAHDLCVDGGTVYVAAASGGLMVLVLEEGRGSQ
jgi:hypothetical protein